MTAGESSSGGDRSAQRRAGEEDRLADSMSRLAALAADSLPLKDLLTRVARYAVRAIPGADGAGLTLLEDGRADTIVATAEFVSAVDAVQYGLGDGPCIMAAREGRTVLSGSLGDEARWGAFGSRVAALGVHSVVSLPLRLGEEVVGAMNVYAHAFDAFDDRAAELGEAFAVPAAVAVQHAHVLEQTRRLVEQLHGSLESRMRVEQALGVVMGRDGVDLAEARRRLEGRALAQGDPVGVVARQVLEETVGPAAGGDQQGG